MGKLPTNKIFKCNLCNQEFQQKQSLSRHKATLCGTKKYSCKKCAKVLNRADTLKIHESKCKGGKELQCRICGSNFDAQWKVIRHIRNVHDNKQSFTCTKCNVSYQRENHYKKHVEKCVVKVRIGIKKPKPLVKRYQVLSSLVIEEACSIPDTDLFSNLVRLSLACSLAESSEVSCSTAALEYPTMVKDLRVAGDVIDFSINEVDYSKLSCGTSSIVQPSMVFDIAECEEPTASCSISYVNKDEEVSPVCLYFFVKSARSLSQKLVCQHIFFFVDSARSL